MSSGHRTSGDVAGALGAYETAPAVMLACEGHDMVLASANEAARVVLGDRCQFGTSVRDMAPEVDRRTIELVDDMVDAVYATGRSIRQAAHRVRVWGEGREPFEVLWDLTVSPWFAEDGSVRGVLAHGVDVTGTIRDPPPTAEATHDLVALQDALLPEWLPVLPGVQVAGRYLLAQKDPEAGGDWYAALGLSDGRVALLVGDIPGHGVAASAAMGRLRAVAEERLASGADLQATVSALDTFARTVPEAAAATVCVVVLDPRTGVLEYCTAGHPPPLVVRADGGQARFLRQSGASPLATTGQLDVARGRLESGDLVVLYTNGMLARPGRTPASSMVELAQVAAAASVGPGGAPASGPADRVCEQALEAMTRGGYADDIAILVAEVTEAVAPLHLDLVADDHAVPHVLGALAGWLQSLRVRDLDHIVVQHAVDELVTNVVEHAYSSSVETGRVTVDAALLATGELEVRFADEGRWMPPHTGPDRGRGLRMVRGMVDRLVLEGDDDGTVATIRHRMSRPAHMLTGAATSAGDWPGDLEEPFTIRVEASCLHLAGSMDHVGLEDLRGAMADLTPLGRVVLDLGGVTRLPSSAVQMLHRACRDAADRGQDLVLYAPAGTTAQHVLELVRLPYVLALPGGDGG